MQSLWDSVLRVIHSWRLCLGHLFHGSAYRSLSFLDAFLGAIVLEPCSESQSIEEVVLEAVVLWQVCRSQFCMEVFITDSCQFWRLVFWSIVVRVTHSRMLLESVLDDAIVVFGCFKAIL